MTEAWSTRTQGTSSASTCNSTQSQFPEPVNLTAASPDLETDPLPSPDGRYILFKRAQLEEGGRLAYWYMRDGSEARRVGPLPATPNWSPDATRLATYQEATRSETARPNEYFLELVELPSGIGDPFAASNGETRYVNWLDDSTLFYVAMYITVDLTEVKAVVYSVGAKSGAAEKGLGTLKSLDDPDQAYVFYLSRDRGGWLTRVRWGWSSSTSSRRRCTGRRWSPPSPPWTGPPRLPAIPG